MDNYKIIKPEAAGDFAGASESVVRQMGEFLAAEEVAGRSPVYVRFFLSDAQNQAVALRNALEALALRPSNARTGGPLRATDGPFAFRGKQTVLDGVPYWVVYLRDISDYAKVDAYMQARFPDTPRIILEARVCRPGWLIEMECEV